MCDTCSDQEKHELEREVGRLREDLLVLRGMLDARAAEVTRLRAELAKCRCGFRRATSEDET